MFDGPTHHRSSRPTASTTSTPTTSRSPPVQPRCSRCARATCSAGIYTPKAAAKALAAGVDLGTVVTVGADLVALHGEGRVREVELADGTRLACDSVIVALGSAPRDVLARMAPMVPVDIVGPAAAAHALAAGATRRRHLPVRQDHRRGPRRRVGEGLPRPRAGQARQPVRRRHVPGRGLHAAPALVRRRSQWRGAQAVHRTPGGASGVAGGGRGRLPHRHLPPHAAARRAREARRHARQLRRLVPPVELRRRRRRVLGRPRGRVAGRREHARQDDGVRPRCRGGAGAALPEPRARHQGRPVALRDQPQRARPRARRRHDLPRGRHALPAHVHVGRREHRRDVGARLGGDLGSEGARARSHRVARRDQRHRPAGGRAAPPGRRRRRRAPQVPPAPPPRRRGHPVPRDAALVHRRGELRAAPPDRPFGGAVADADGARPPARHQAARPAGAVRSPSGEGPRHRRPGHRAGQLARGASTWTGP